MKDDIVIAAAPLANQTLLVFVYGFSTREGRLLRISGDGVAAVDIEDGAPDQVNGMGRSGDRILVTHDDGSIARPDPELSQ